MSDDDDKVRRLSKALAEAVGTRPPRDSSAEQKARLLALVSDIGATGQKSVAGSKWSVSRRGAWSPDKKVRWLKLGLPLALAAGLLVLVSGILLMTGQHRLAFHLGGGAKGETGAPVLATGSDLPIRFEDGSTLILITSSEGRVERSTSKEVTFRLVDGAVIASIRRDEKRAWMIKAGKHEVSVLEGRVRVVWSRIEGTLDIQVLEGRARMTGPGLAAEEGKLLLAGESYQARASDR